MNKGPMISAAGRNLVLVAFASLVLIAASITPSAANSPAPTKTAAAGPAAPAATDFSAAARRHRYYRRGPNAAGLAFMGVAAGLIGGAIAESRRQEYYEDRYNYGPGPYYGGQGYYGGGPYYGPRGYYQPY
jgi:peptidoglycan/LPS O-acetylase OafA/YrhL